jgi:mono/diheme cytochrome c family protein
MKTVGVIVSVLVVELILLVIFVNSGLYNVSTMSPDPAFIHWVFSRTSDNSAEHYSKGIAVPPLTDSSMVVEGYGHYHEMCETCHGAPGVDRSEIGQGLYPHPPNLVHSAKEMGAGRLFWVVKNGIKSTGMPGFGKTHSDQKIWAIVAFLEKMKDMTPEQFAAMQKTAANEEGTENMNMETPHRVHKKK